MTKMWWIPITHMYKWKNSLVDVFLHKVRLSLKKFNRKEREFQEQAKLLKKEDQKLFEILNNRQALSFLEFILDIT